VSFNTYASIVLIGRFYAFFRSFAVPLLLHELLFMSLFFNFPSSLITDLLLLFLFLFLSHYFHLILPSSLPFPSPISSFIIPFPSPPLPSPFLPVSLLYSHSLFISLSSPRLFYPAHKSNTEVSSGLMSKRYLKGTLRVKR
jgi:hypothetical protein